MVADRINNWLTLAANVGVIVSLLFLAFEINQSTKATIAAASQGLTDQSVAYFDVQLDREVISEAVYKQRHGTDLSDYEVYQLGLLQRLNFRVFESAFLQYQRGFYEEGEWQRYRRIISGHMSNNPVAIQMWEESKGGWTDEFEAEVESLRKENDRSSEQTLQDLLIENHFAYIPSDQGRFPTIIAIPGCSGISSDSWAEEETNPLLREDDLLFRRHYRLMAERLQANGFAVLLVNIHAAEGLLTACADPIDGERIAAYIDEAVAWARELPFVDPDRLHIIGWSMGGGGVLQWLDGPRDEASSVRSAIAVYPPCKKLKNLSIPVPVLVLLGGSDDIADPTICEELVASASIRQHIVANVYHEARHGFDIEDAPPLLDIGNGMTVGYQKEAAEASWVSILRFLADSGEFRIQ